MVSLVRPIAAYLLSSSKWLQHQYTGDICCYFPKPRSNSYKSICSSFIALTAVAATTSSTTHGITKNTNSRTTMMTALSTSTTSTDMDGDDNHNNNNNKMIDDDNTYNTGYLNAVDAAALDAELMSTPGYTLEQLMELAGLAVAEAIYDVIATTTKHINQNNPKNLGILIICGPGNNGGDGLVAARHLYMFGYTNIKIVYPSKSKIKHLHYINLIQQCYDLDIPIIEEMPNDYATNYNIIVDGIFGFSFHGIPRSPYDTIIQQLISLNHNDNVTVVSIDVPSGWDVDGMEGKINNPNIDTNNERGMGQQDQYIIPNVLISLTVPKLCSKQFYNGRHYIGGRFLPMKLANKYNITMPPYPNIAQVIEITKTNTTGSNTASTQSNNST